jgi:hypothetical protein
LGRGGLLAAAEAKPSALLGRLGPLVLLCRLHGRCGRLVRAGRLFGRRHGTPRIRPRATLLLQAVGLPGATLLRAVGLPGVTLLQGIWLLRATLLLRASWPPRVTLLRATWLLETTRLPGVALLRATRLLKSTWLLCATWLLRAASGLIAVTLGSLGCSGRRLAGPPAAVVGPIALLAGAATAPVLDPGDLLAAPVVGASAGLVRRLELVAATLPLVDPGDTLVPARVSRDGPLRGRCRRPLGRLRRWPRRRLLARP